MCIRDSIRTTDGVFNMFLSHYIGKCFEKDIVGVHCVGWNLNSEKDADVEQFRNGSWPRFLELFQKGVRRTPNLPRSVSPEPVRQTMPTQGRNPFFIDTMWERSGPWNWCWLCDKWATTDDHERGSAHQKRVLNTELTSRGPPDPTDRSRWPAGGCPPCYVNPVSYTHLTLPTILLV